MTCLTVRCDDVDCVANGGDGFCTATIIELKFATHRWTEFNLPVPNPASNLVCTTHRIRRKKP